MKSFFGRLRSIRVNRLTADAKGLGVWGEKYCERYLKRNGFEIMARNFRSRGGEVDIIAAEQSSIIFVEVKSRRDTDFVEPEAAINNIKKQRIKRAAKDFLVRNGRPDVPMRFDVVFVIVGETGRAEVRHYRDAF